MVFRAGCWLLASAVLVSLAGSHAGQPADGPLERFEFTERHMGMPVKLVLYAADGNAANMAAKAAYARIAKLDQALSDYLPESELMQLCGTAGSGRAVRVSDDLWNVLARAQQLAQTTDGAFDVTVGPLVRLWRRARREKELPKTEQLADARRVVGFQMLVLDADTHTAMLTEPKMRLDLGGIAAGYAVDEAMHVLKRCGIERALIDASGDIAVSQPPLGQSGWKIGIVGLDPQQQPRHYLLLANQAISTAGDAFQYVEIDGRRYSHIVDPKTGLGLTQSSLVAVVAPDCMTADGLDTAVSVLGPEKGLELIDQTPKAAGLIIRAEGEPPAVRTYESARFKQLPRAAQ